MKYFTILLFVSLCLSGDLFAQGGGNICTQPLSDYQFRDFKNQVSRAYGDQNKLNFTRNALQNACFLSVQVKEIAQMFSTDESRFEFARDAFHKTVDKTNFYEVYDAFTRFSMVFRLHDALTARGGRQWNDPSTNYNPNPNNNNPNQNPNDPNYNPNNPGNDPSNYSNYDPRFPNLEYPNYTPYNGRKNCSNPISESEFNRLVQGMQNGNPSNQNMNYLNSYCLSTAQAMKIASLINQENIRYEFLRGAFTHVYDIDNYSAVNQLLSTAQYQSGILALVNSNFSTPGNNITSTNTNCQVNGDEFKSISDRIHNLAWDQEKLSTAKVILKSKKCFSSAQIRDLTKQFSFSESKKDFVKFAYDYVNDTANYYVVTDAFTFPSDKEEILKFIESKQ